MIWFERLDKFSNIINSFTKQPKNDDNEETKSINNQRNCFIWWWEREQQASKSHENEENEKTFNAVSKDLLNSLPVLVSYFIKTREGWFCHNFHFNETTEAKGSARN